MNSNVVVEVTKVSEVLLSDGWHSVKAGTFAMGDLAFVEGDGSGKHIGPDLDDRNPAVQWTEREGDSSWLGLLLSKR